MEIRGRRCESGQGLLEGLRDRFCSGKSRRLSSGFAAIGVGFNARGQSET